jgi:hypothetical protein
MNEDELVEKLSLQIRDLKDTIDQSGAVRAFVEQDLLSENEAEDEQVTLIYSLIQRSEAIRELIDDFLNSSPDRRELADEANQIVAEAKAEIARFQENKFLEEFGDVTDETDTVQ